MRVVVFGGRDYQNRTVMFRVLDDLDRIECIDCLIEGEADGADRLARRWAESRGVPFHPFPALWDDIHRPGAVVRRRKDGTFYDLLAGPRRNRQMIFEGRPDLGLMFPGGSGTRDMATQLVEAGVTLKKVRAA